MKLLSLLAGAALAALTVGGAHASVVYQSVPNFAPGSGGSEWCSDCYGGGTFEPLDPFTLSAGASVTGLTLTAYNIGGYSALSNFTFEIYDATHSTILFSRSVSPSLVSVGGSDAQVTGNFAAINLAAGSYWAGFIAPHFAVTGFGGGNGGLIDTTPHTGNQVLTLGGNTGYQLLGGGGVPEPASWALMLLGVGCLGATLRTRRKAALAA